MGTRSRYLLFLPVLLIFGFPIALWAQNCAPTPIVLVYSGNGSDVITSENGSPVNIPAVVVTGAGLPLSAWGTPCGSSSFVGFDTGGTSPESSGPFTYTFQETFTVQSAWLLPGAGTFDITYKVDDNAAVTIQGQQVSSCNGNNAGNCFYGGCQTAVIPSGLLSAGSNTLEFSVTDVGVGHTGASFEVDFIPPTCTPTPTMTSTPSNTPTITFTPTITNTFTITFTPTITPTPRPHCDTFYISKNIFVPSQGSVSIYVDYCQTTGPYYLKIYNSAGEYIRTLGEGIWDPLSARSFFWDGQNKDRQDCASGVYILYLEEPFSLKTKRILLAR